MLAMIYDGKGRIALGEKPEPELLLPGDAIVRVTLASICTSDLHIRNGAVPRAKAGVTVGHEMVGIVERVGSAVHTFRSGDRVTVNVETFCGKCFFCRRGYVNNCEDAEGGWALGCLIDGGLAEFVRVPHAEQGLNRIPEGVSDEQALFVGDLLSTGYWATKITGIGPEDTVLILGAGPTGLCTLLCARLKHPRRLIVCEPDEFRRETAAKLVPEALTVGAEGVEEFVRAHSEHGGADAVLEVAGGTDTFDTAWRCARPNATVTVVAMYERPQVLPLPEMYGKNLTFRTGGVDACDCGAILEEIRSGHLDATPLITHRFSLREAEEALALFAGRKDRVLKVAIRP